MPQIELAYDWTGPGASAAPARDRRSPLRNPLMDLLGAVHAAGSISGAARCLGCSYRHVWGELKRWETQLQAPLIVWEKGQKARLTPFADKLLWAERQAQARLAPAISHLQAELEKTFATAFDPTQHLLTVYASHDDALVELREQAAGSGLHLDLRFCGSVDAIRALNEGRCTVAGFHVPLLPQADSLVARTYRPLLQTGRHKLIGFARRAQGLMVAPGNPLGIAGLADLARPDRRWVHRSRGTGTRLLLDQELARLGLAPDALSGPEESSHRAVAAAVAAGQADAGLGIASAAALHGLDFVPLLQEDYWLVCLADALETAPLTALRQHLASPGWTERLSALPGYACDERTAMVQSLRRTLPWWPVKGKHQDF